MGASAPFGMKTNDTPYQFNISERIYKLLANIAAVRGGSVAQALSKAVEEYHDEIVHNGAVLTR